MTLPTENPERYVREHRETLLRIIKHGDDTFVRAMALAALVKYGDEPTLTELRHEVDHAWEWEDDR